MLAKKLEESSRLPSLKYIIGAFGLLSPLSRQVKIIEYNFR